MVHAGAGSAGIEWRASEKQAFAVYYGADYFGRNFFPDTTNTHTSRNDYRIWRARLAEHKQSGHSAGHFRLAADILEKSQLWSAADLRSIFLFDARSMVCSSGRSQECASQHGLLRLSLRIAFHLRHPASCALPKLERRHVGTRQIAFSLRVAVLLVAVLCANCAEAQSAPMSSDHPWHGDGERGIEAAAKNFGGSSFRIDPDKTYSLSELIDLAESHNPVTRVAWERARAQAAALGVARSELYPTLAATALSGVARSQAYLVDRFYRQTIGDFQVSLDLNYTVFDFGARSARINAARAEVLAANFSFNDTHRKIIFQVEQAYYQLLNAMGQEDAARASLANAQAVQQSAEERLKNGLATLPDVLEAHSATAQADYELQSVLGTERVAAGNLATALGVSATTAINVQPLQELPIPQSVDESVDAAIDRALAQRPDLLQQVASMRSANAKVKEARADLLSLPGFHGQPDRAIAIRNAATVPVGAHGWPGRRNGA